MTQKLLTENRAIDLFVTYRFLKLLVTPWDKQEAYKLGIIDKNGSRIKSKKLVTSDEKSAFTLLHRLVFNCKRIMSKIPLVRTQLGTYVTALFLLKEHYGIQIPEQQGFGNMLPAGQYTLKDQVTADDEEIDAQKGDRVVAIEDTPPSDTVLGVDIFPVVHQKSNKKIYVSLEDIK